MRMFYIGAPVCLQTVNYVGTMRAGRAPLSLADYKTGKTERRPGDGWPFVGPAGASSSPRHAHLAIENVSGDLDSHPSTDPRHSSKLARKERDSAILYKNIYIYVS